MLHIAIQQALMRRYFPAFRYRRAEHAWYGTLQPTATSRHYSVKVRYRPGEPPRVWVLGRALDPATRHLHRYRDGALCLYHPDDGDWRDDRALATTILPWAAEWLFYYVMLAPRPRAPLARPRGAAYRNERVRGVAHPGGDVR